jgi:hypothetical protein
MRRSNSPPSCHLRPLHLAASFASSLRTIRDHSHRASPSELAKSRLLPRSRSCAPPWLPRRGRPSTAVLSPFHHMICAHSCTTKLISSLVARFVHRSCRNTSLPPVHHCRLRLPRRQPRLSRLRFNHLVGRVTVSSSLLSLTSARLVSRRSRRSTTMLPCCAPPPRHGRRHGCRSMVEDPPMLLLDAP